MQVMLTVFRRSGRNTRHLVMVGAGTKAVEIASRIDSRPELGYQIVGFFCDDDGDEVPHEAVADGVAVVHGLLVVQGVVDGDVPRGERITVIFRVDICHVNMPRIVYRSLRLFKEPPTYYV